MQSILRAYRTILKHTPVSTHPSYRQNILLHLEQYQNNPQHLLDQARYVQLRKEYTVTIYWLLLGNPGSLQYSHLP